MPLIHSLLIRLLRTDRPYLTLTLLFVIWKAFLLCLVLLAPGPGYDTSTTLLPPLDDDEHGYGVSSKLQRLLAAKFVRWDAIYFTQSAKRGYVYEQEWAFGWGHTHSLGFATRLFYGRQEIETQHVAVVGVALAHLFHWASALVLYDLTRAVFDSRPDPKVGKSGPNLALLSSVLHVLSPAGVFLSAPYAEPFFSLLSFAGYLAYVKGIRTRPIDSVWQAFAWQLLAGVFFGVSATVRGNGLFSGLLFLYDAIESVLKAVGQQGALASESLRKTLSAGVSGLVMGVLACLPQVLAYHDFCSSPNPDDRRPWCQAIPPSIYAWVQKEYWGVGFMQYWTIPNVPLFILAAPMLTIMALSCRWAWKSARSEMHQTTPARTEEDTKRQDRKLEASLDPSLLFRISLPQLLLAVLAFTTYHVQVITRLSSGYAVWYWWLSSLLMDESESQHTSRSVKMSRVIVVWMVTYAIIQGGLFASFLPPA